MWNHHKHKCSVCVCVCVCVRARQRSGCKVQWSGPASAQVRVGSSNNMQHQQPSLTSSWSVLALWDLGSALGRLKYPSAPPSLSTLQPMSCDSCQGPPLSFWPPLLVCPASEQRPQQGPSVLLSPLSHVQLKLVWPNWFWPGFSAARIVSQPTHWTRCKQYSAFPKVSVATVPCLKQ